MLYADKIKIIWIQERKFLGNAFRREEPTHDIVGHNKSIQCSHLIVFYARY